MLAPNVGSELPLLLPSDRFAPNAGAGAVVGVAPNAGAVAPNAGVDVPNVAAGAAVAPKAGFGVLSVMFGRFVGLGWS